MARTIESLMLDGPAGRLEALLEEPEDQTPNEAVLVCHPHPKGGGTMHNKVVYRLARGLRSTGSVVLRFNYRGVNLSEGNYDEGRGEREDARAALDFLRNRYPAVPFSLAGFSFGSRIIMSLGCEVAGPARLIPVGYPTTYPVLPEIERCTVPRQFLHSTEDEFGPRDQFQTFYDRLPEPKSLAWVDAADHFFKGALDVFEQRVRELPK